MAEHPCELEVELEWSMEKREWFESGLQMLRNGEIGHQPEWELPVRERTYLDVETRIGAEVQRCKAFQKANGTKLESRHTHPMLPAEVDDFYFHSEIARRNMDITLVPAEIRVPHANCLNRVAPEPYFLIRPAIGIYPHEISERLDVGRDEEHLQVADYLSILPALDKPVLHYDYEWSSPWPAEGYFLSKMVGSLGHHRPILCEDDEGRFVTIKSWRDKKDHISVSEAKLFDASVNAELVPVARIPARFPAKAA